MQCGSCWRRLLKIEQEDNAFNVNIMRRLDNGSYIFIVTYNFMHALLFKYEI